MFIVVYVALPKPQAILRRHLNYLPLRLLNQEIKELHPTIGAHMEQLRTEQNDGIFE